jgi:DNA adenine methylase
MLNSINQPITPFLKWAGGKRWLLEWVQAELPEKYGIYFEPFLGGGAIFFGVRPQQAVLADLNAELVETYICLKQNWQLVRRYLGEYASAHSKEHYYEERDAISRSKFKNAARLIYLNRVCWNGLYRVNLKGKFNVPIGTKTEVLLDTDDFGTVSKALKRARLLNWDFEKTLELSERGDFVFIDPPYITAHNFNGFIKYNEKIFSWNDQIRLRDAIASARKRGVKILMSNADHPSIEKLYAGLGHTRSIERASVIAGTSNYRQKTTEFLLKTYS